MVFTFSSIFRPLVLFRAELPPIFVFFYVKRDMRWQKEMIFFLANNFSAADTAGERVLSTSFAEGKLRPISFFR